MSHFERGTVKAISLEIEYPDGRTKTERLEDTDDIAALVFHEQRLASSDVEASNVSESDWTENPTMVIYRMDGRGIPYCMYCMGPPPPGRLELVD